MFTCPASYFRWENRYLRPAMPQVYVALDILGRRVGIGGRYTSRLMFWVGNKAARSQIHARLHILDGKTGSCDRPGLRYLTGFIFWVGKQVPATGQVSGTCQASYFGWENRYLQPARSQVLDKLHILGRKTGICDRQARYRSQIHAGLHILGRKTGTCDRQARYRSVVQLPPHYNFYKWKSENTYV